MITKKQKIYQKKWRAKLKIENPKRYKKKREYNTEWVRKKRGSSKRIKNKYSDILKGLSPKDRLRKIRLIVLEHYSNGTLKCICCNEKEIKFLSIDHINGGGNIHRKKITKTGKGGNMNWWLLKNNFPKGFQVLCYNCNMAKGFYGICPHNQKSGIIN